MTHRQIELVQASFRKLEYRGEDAAQLFFTRLFEMEPSLRWLFRGDLRKQGRELMDTIGAAVDALRRFDQLAAAAGHFRKGLAAYGVREAHYTKAAAALLRTLSQSLGETFTAEVCEAWLAMYAAVSAAMRQDANHAAAAMTPAA